MSQKNFLKYLHVTDFEYKWGMYVTCAGYTQINPGDNYPNNEAHPKKYHLTWDRGRIINDFKIVYITKGKGLFSSAHSKPKKISTGDCFLLFPGVRHRYKPDSEKGWEEYWVGFNGIQIHHLMKEGVFDKANPVINLGYDSELLVLFKRLIEKIKFFHVGYPQQIAGITQQILGIINARANYSHFGNTPDEKLIAKAKYIMQQSFEDSIDIQNISDELPMGYSSFRKKFKEFTGFSPNQYILELRLKRAKNLLLITKLNISEISYQIGFSNIYYFSKMFKKKYGSSPKAFRVQNTSS